MSKNISIVSPLKFHIKAIFQGINRNDQGINRNDQGADTLFHPYK
jgi:hypothetical protein